MTTQLSDSSPSPFMKRELIPAISSLELLDFLELSINEKTDAYLQKLALLAARNQGNNTAKQKKKPITGTVTVPKSILLSIHHWNGSEFTLVIDAISHALRYQTWKWINSDTELTGEVIFWNPELDADGTFTLNFPEIQKEFKVSPSMLHLHQKFNAKVLAIGSKFVELRLVENLPEIKN